MSHPTTRLGQSIGLAGILVVVIWLLMLPPLQSAQGQSVKAVMTHGDGAASSNFTITLEFVTGGLVNPDYLTHAGDGSGRLFVLEQGGTVRVIRNGTLLPTPFLNLTNQVSCCDEQGLLGIAFDPDYATNGTFYVDYTNLEGFGNTNIERFVVSDPAADVANVIAATKIITIDQPEQNHNGGQLEFGPDGYLYIGMGDGGGQGDPHGVIGNGQDPSVLLGKILRVNVRGVPTYTIPPSNPFTQTAGYRPEIWALGLRNPWRFSFDRLNGDLYIGDVGQNCWEEIDYQPGTSQGGENYGWRIMEGFHAFDPATMNDCGRPTITPAGITRPITDYSHDGTCASVTGGYVYRGSTYPQMAGVYFFSDFCKGHILTEEQISPGVWVSDDKLTSGYQISSFGQDQSGELYVLSYMGGQVYKIVSTSGAPLPNLSTSTKQASSHNSIFGNSLNYTIVLRNTGGPFNNTVRVTDTIPAGLSYVPGSFTATKGTVDASAAPTLKWNGVMSNTPTITLTYGVTVTTLLGQPITNVASINPAVLPVFTRSATVQIAPAPPNLSTSIKQAACPVARSGDTITYTIVLRNTGGPVTNTLRVTDTIPTGLSYLPGSFSASSGTPDDTAAPTLTWSSVPTGTLPITLTYRVTVSTENTTLIVNSADINAGVGALLIRAASVIINPRQVYLPLALRNF